MLDFISTALAADSVKPAASLNDSLASLVPIFLIFFIFYFMLIRPQAKKQREHNLMLSQLKVNDKVIVANSIVGKVSMVKEGEELIHVEIAPNTYIEVVKNSVSKQVDKEAAKNSENNTKINNEKKLKNKKKG